MKFAVVVVLVCLAICSVYAEKIQLWGNTNGVEVGRQSFSVSSTWLQVKTKEFTYRSVSSILFSLQQI